MTGCVPAILEELGLLASHAQLAGSPSSSRAAMTPVYF